MNDQESIKFVWHCVLDNRSCAECRELDGKTLTKREIDHIQSNLHKEAEDECRCFFTRI